ncbi:hypothetical protein KC921_05400, partial [Candidatus Woesebacteria bacterium]|nr:hypothetical protein [Candidatus Woesebacteria bacterium]
MNLKTITLLVSIFFVALSGCSKNGTTGPSGNYQEMIDDAWTSFATGNYASSDSLFDAASKVDNTQAAAFTGRGWSNMMMDNLLTAQTHFTTASEKKNPTANSYFGIAFCLNMQGFYGQSNEQALLGLNLDDSWQFDY